VAKRTVYAASVLPEIEFDLLDCLSIEESMTSSAGLFVKYELSEYLVPDVEAALLRLCDKKMADAVFFKSMGGTLAMYRITEYGRDVITFSERTITEIDDGEHLPEVRLGQQDRPLDAGDGAPPHDPV